MESYGVLFSRSPQYSRKQMLSITRIILWSTSGICNKGTNANHAPPDCKTKDLTPVGPSSEKNRNKVIEGRLTVRPLPDVVPGFQLTYFGTTGKGNTDKKPGWTTNIAFGSYESEPVVLTGQYYWGKGQQNGANETEKDGYSLFTELKLYNMFKNPVNRFSMIGRYDHFDPNTNNKDDENTRYIAGVAYYLDKPHKNMVLLDYDTVNYKQAGKSDDKRVQLTLQVAF